MVLVTAIFKSLKIFHISNVLCENTSLSCTTGTLEIREVLEAEGILLKTVEGRSDPEHPEDEEERTKLQDETESLE